MWKRVFERTQEGKSRAASYFEAISFTAVLRADRAGDRAGRGGADTAADCLIREENIKTQETARAKLFESPSALESGGLGLDQQRKVVPTRQTEK